MPRFATAMLAAAALAFMLPMAAHAEEHVLFEIPLEMNGNSEMDRAMLVIVGDKLDIPEATPLDFYMLADGERADLLIFLDVGDDALNVTDEPSFRKEGVATADGLRFVLQQQATAKGSLNLITSNGFGNTFNTTDTLTIVNRDGRFLVAGWARNFYNSREEQSSHCSVNYLSGKAVRRENQGKNVALKGKFKPVRLVDWDATKTPAVCDE